MFIRVALRGLLVVTGRAWCVAGGYKRESDAGTAAVPVIGAPDITVILAPERRKGAKVNKVSPTFLSESQLSR